MLTIGCHLSDKQGFMGMALDASALGADTFQFFTRNPRGGHAKEWDPKDIEDYKAYAKEHGFAPFYAYAPYTANPASAEMKEADFARVAYLEDLNRLQAIPGQFYAAHPGSAVGISKDEGIANAAKLMNEVLASDQDTTFLFITTSGRGTEIASTFEEMAELLRGIKLESHVGVCFDVCGVWGAGYDIKNDLDGVIEKFDKLVGVDRIQEIHLADPKYDLGTHHDHHDALGEGMLGMDTFERVINHPALADKPFILETPHDDLALYEKTIKTLQNAYKGQ